MCYIEMCVICRILIITLIHVQMCWGEGGSMHMWHKQYLSGDLNLAKDVFSKLLFIYIYTQCDVVYFSLLFQIF